MEPSQSCALPAPFSFTTLAIARYAIYCAAARCVGRAPSACTRARPSTGAPRGTGRSCRTRSLAVPVVFHLHRALVAYPVRYEIGMIRCDTQHLAAPCADHSHAAPPFRPHIELLDLYQTFSRHYPFCYWWRIPIAFNPKPTTSRAVRMTLLDTALTICLGAYSFASGSTPIPRCYVRTMLNPFFA